MNRSTSLFAVLVLSAATVVAQDAWKLDRSHANVGFNVTHMLISEVPGSFRTFDIEFSATKEDFTDASVKATINVASLDTDNERRNGHLKSDDFFNAEAYPTITFTSTKFEKVDDKNYKIHGDLTIRDVTKPVVFDAKLIGVLTTQRGTMSGWKASLTIDRFDYNLKWNRAIETGGLVVSRDVEIVLNAESMKSAQTGG